jgi:hypothetical protein
MLAPFSKVLVIVVTYWRTSVPEEDRASLSKARFSSFGNFTTTIIVLLLMFRDPPFRKVTRPCLLDLKLYATGCDANRFTILALLLDIAS